MVKNLKHSNYQAEFAVPQNKIFVSYSGGYLSSKRGSDLGWGHLYVTAVLLIKKVAMCSWMMYDQKN